MSSTTLTPYEVATFHESRQHVLVGCLATFLIIGNVSVALKIWVQFRSAAKKFLAEDYCLIVALASANAVCASYLEATHYGLGLHIYRVTTDDPTPPQRLIHVYYWIWLPAVFNAPVFAGIKFALLFLYRRLFLVYQRWLNVAWWINVVYLAAWFLGSLIYYILLCTPPSYYWNRLYAANHLQPPHPYHGTCSSPSPAEGALTLIFAVVQDFAILILPAISLIGLQMSLKKKIGLVSLFSLGTLACALEVARIIDRTVDSGIHGEGKLEDPTYDLCNFVIITCAVEMIGIMCACFPVVGPRVFRAFEELRSWKREEGISRLGEIVTMSAEVPPAGEDSSGVQTSSVEPGKGSDGTSD